MSAPNGHADESVPSKINGFEEAPTPIAFVIPPRFSSERLAQIVAELEVPFEAALIEWRVTNSSKDKSRGQVIPYADQRAYTDRLNLLLTPAGWTREYELHTSPNFQRSKDQKTVAKILVTCKVTIFGIGSHSATGEEWADDDNAGTAAEAQAFKRACSCFGLGRYLYYFEGIWVDLDDHKRPRNFPKLPSWATPKGWSGGLRPQNGNQDGGSACRANGPGQNPDPRSANKSVDGSLVRQIEAMAKPLGKALYRGILKSAAGVWDPKQINDSPVAQRVLEQMHAGERGLERLRAAVETVGTEPLNRIISSLGVRSLERIDTLETLKRLVLSLEELNQPK